MLLQTLLACGLVVGCALLNRVRGGGFGGDKLPGRALLWVAPVIGLLAWSIHPWPVALAFAGGYLFWGLWSWGHCLAGLGGYTPPRSPSTLEAALALCGPPLVQTFLRMLFVLPGVAVVAWLIGDWRFLLAAPAFAAAATAAYAGLFRPLGPMDWARAEVAVGACWGILILSPWVLS